MRRLVLDTNVLVSAALFNGSVPHQALMKARSEAFLLASEETVAEFQRVLLQDKFAKHIELDVRQIIVDGYAEECEMVVISEPIRACRDPRRQVS